MNEHANPSPPTPNPSPQWGEGSGAAHFLRLARLPEGAGRQRADSDKASRRGLRALAQHAGADAAIVNTSGFLDSAKAESLAALDAYAPRRRPRVDWVQRQSEAVGRSALLPAVMRGAVLRQQGTQQFEARYAPLISAP